MNYAKYKAKSIIIDWYKFDSTIEWDYYLYLKNKWIDEFTIHPKYELQPKFVIWDNKIMAVNYMADFSIMVDWKECVIDIKGMATETAKLKRKMFMYKYPDKELQRIVRYKKERVDYFDNIKRRKEAKKLKVQKVNQ